jgi:hypothetical protein
VRDDSLELDSDQRFQKREWRFQRVAWVFFALFLLAALGGALGDGPLAKSRARSPQGKIVADYERVCRKHAPSVIGISVNDSPAPARVWMSRRASMDLGVQRVEPEPDHVEGDHERIVWEFGPRNRDGGPWVTLVTLHLEPDSPGVVDAALGLVGGEEVRFRQFVLP